MEGEESLLWLSPTLFPASYSSWLPEVCVFVYERERECVCVPGRGVMWRETGQSWTQAVLGAWRSLGKAWAWRGKWLLSSSTLTTPACKFCLFLSWMPYLWIRTPVSLEGSVGVLLAQMLAYKPLINHNYCFRMSRRFFYGEDKPSLKYVFIFRVSLMPQRVKCFELCLCPCGWWWYINNHPSEKQQAWWPLT